VPFGWIDPVGRASSRPAAPWRPQCLRPQRHWTQPFPSPAAMAPR